MANILEFLRSVLTEPEAQGAFRSDPGGYVEQAGFVDLTGEDVVEAVLVLRRSLPDDLAARLGAFEDDDDLPAVRPGPEETELDAAVRMLTFAIAESGAVGGEPSADEPIDVENELDTDLAATATPQFTAQLAPASAPTGGSAEAGEAVRRFSDALDTLVIGASAAIQDAAAAARTAVAQAIAAADADTAKLRAEGKEEREAARRDVERTRTEADNELQRAREQAEESRRRAEELVATAEAEAETTRTELTAEREELREIERQLKDRLSGIDSLFRTALGDEGEPAPPT